MRLSDKTSYALGDGSYTLGRADDCAITLQGVPGVSRKHARLTVRGNSCSLEDLRSTNGVFVNGAKVSSNTSVELHAGDRFALAREEFDLDRMKK